MKNNMCISMWASVVLMLALGMQQAIAADPGFIENMPQLTQDPDRPGAMIWQKPGVNRAAYKKVMIEPITIFISPESEYKGLDPNDLKTLSDKFIEVVTKTLEPDIEVVQQAGPGVMYLRAALTNVKVAKKKKGLLGYTPVGLVAGAVAGPTILVKDATLEIEMLDSASGERLGVLVDKAPKMPDEKVTEMEEGPGQKKAGEEDKGLSWESIEKTFAFYAERFKARMQAAK